MEGRATAESFDALHEALRQLDPEELVEFKEELDNAICALSTPEHLEQSVRDPSEVGVEGAAELPLVGTAALGAACAVIIEGAEAFERVVNNPQELAGLRPIADSAELVEVPELAYEELTGAGAIGDIPWLSGGFVDFFGSVWDVFGDRSEPYFDRITELCRALCEDGEWVEWWAATRYDRMLLDLLYRKGADFKVQTKKVKKVEGSPSTLRVDVTLPPRMADLSTVEAEQLADRDIAQVMDVLADRFGLGAAPPLPRPELDK